MISLSAQVAIKQYQDISSEIQDLQEKLDSLKETRVLLETKVIPNELRMNGLSRLTTDDGFEIKLDRFLKPKIIDKSRFYDWISDQGYGSIIKTSFDLDKGVETGGLEEYLVDQGIDYTKEVGIHHKSLEKAINDIVEQTEMACPEMTIEEMFPSSIVEVDVFTKASIKRSR